MLFCLTLTGAANATASDGPVVDWGDDFYGQTAPPDVFNGDSGTGIAIAAGGSHSCAIQAGTGNVVCWGSDFYGQWDGEIPGKRACDPGLYTARILDVTAPSQTNMVWNEMASEMEASITLEVKAQ